MAKIFLPSRRAAVFMKPDFKLSAQGFYISKVIFKVLPGKEFFVPGVISREISKKLGRG